MPKTTEEVHESLKDFNRKSGYAAWRDRYSDIGTVNQGLRKDEEDKRDPKGEYLTKNKYSVNATKVIKLLANENHGKFSLIATQCPKKDTLNGFFDLIYDSKVDAVVVLGSVSTGRIDDYWSENRTIEPGYTFGGPRYELSSKEVSGGPGYKRYAISVTQYDGDSEKGKKELELFHYYDWPDGNVPKDRDDFEKFVKLNDFKDKRKLVVHCSAGVGRTGTFAACLQAWKEKSKDPFKTVQELRKYRTTMVQTPEQFDYVCKFIARNCTGVGKKEPPEWDDELDYEKYFGKSERDVRK